MIRDNNLAKWLIAPQDDMAAVLAPDHKPERRCKSGRRLPEACSHGYDFSIEVIFLHWQTIFSHNGDVALNGLFYIVERLLLGGALR